jgi:hypothetical protein
MREVARMGLVFQRRPCYETIRQHIDVAKGEQPPTTQQARSERATELAQAATTAASAPVAVNWRAFALAFAIFLGLLCLAILLDWKDVVAQSLGS